MERSTDNRKVEGSTPFRPTTYLNNRIQKFTSNGTFITKWGSEGTGDGQFNNPVGIVIDSQGNVIAIESQRNFTIGEHIDNRNRIQKFTANGTFITAWYSNGTVIGNSGGSPIFSHQNVIAIDSQNNVYVSDGDNRIQKFTSDGTFITKWGSSIAHELGNFASPGGIAIDSSGNVYVSHSGNDRIQVFAPPSR